MQCHVEPGKPVQTAFIESSMADFATNASTKMILRQFSTCGRSSRERYNQYRPHGPLSWQTPEEFARSFKIADSVEYPWRHELVKIRYARVFRNVSTSWRAIEFYGVHILFVACSQKRSSQYMTVPTRKKVCTMPDAKTVKKATTKKSAASRTV